METCGGQSLGEIARTNYLQRRTGSLLTVRMLCRRAQLRVPEGVSEVSVEMPAVRGAADGMVSIGNVATRWERDGRNLRSLGMRVDRDTVDIVITPPKAFPTATAARPRASTWALIRRLIAESRDRAQPMGRHTGSRCSVMAAALPNLLIIGAAKCGTTSLHFYLDQHPDVFMARPHDSHWGQKEMRLFWRDDWRERLEWYEQHFDPSAPVRGEATPSYTHYPFLPDVPRRIHSIIPEAKLIYIVRDPIDRIVAHWAQTQEDGDRTPLEEALADYDRPGSSPRLCQQVRHPGRPISRVFPTGAASGARYGRAEEASSEDD